MTLEQADRCCRHGAVAAWISAGATLFIVLVAMLVGAGGGALELFNDPFNLFDVVFLAACAWFIRRHSRAAALLLFVYFLMGKVYFTLETGNYAQLAFAAIFLWFFGRAVFGSYAWHRLERAGNPDYRPPSRWSFWLGIPLALFAFAVTLLGMFMELGFATPTHVIEGSALSAEQRAFLLAEGILHPQESAELFYSIGPFGIEDEGNLLTDRRVVSYERIGGELTVYEAASEQVVAVDIVQEGSAAADTIAEIYTRDGSGFRVQLSAEGNGDLRFIRRLRDRIVPAQ